jgi:hypothetical protein
MLYFLYGLMEFELLGSQIVGIWMVPSGEQIHKLRAASICSGEMNAEEAVSRPYGIQGFGGLFDIEGDSRRVQADSAE